MSKKGRQRTDEQVEELLNEVRRYLNIGASYSEIMKFMKLPSSTFYYYLHIIAKEDKKTLKDLRGKILDHETIVCKNRLERSIYKCEQISSNANTLPKERIEAERLKAQLAIDVLRIVRDGIDIETAGQDKETQDSDYGFKEPEVTEFLKSIS